MCNAHLLRDLTFIAEGEPIHHGWANNLAMLLLEMKKAVELTRSNSLNSLDESLKNTFSKRYDRIMEQAERVIRGSPERKFAHLSARTLQRRFVRNMESQLF